MASLKDKQDIVGADTTSRIIVFQDGIRHYHEPVEGIS
jgi:hypothetical protein